MQEYDLKRFVALMAGIGELYDRPLSEPLIELYWQSLKMFEWQAVQQALKAHIHNPDGGQFFPRPADVVRWIEGSGQVQSLQAWTKVEQAIHRVGRYESIAFDDPLIHAVIESMNGWVKLCATTFDQIPFRSQEFQKRYQGFVLKKPTRYPPYLLGQAECENRKNDYSVKPPVLIGDKSEAQAVLLRGEEAPLFIHFLTQHKRLAQRLIADKPEGNP